MSAKTRDTFTLDFLEWTPWLERAVETGISPEQHARVTSAIGDAPNSDYIAVLANDFGAWKARALVHRHVYTSEDPEPTSWRELGATTTSRRPPVDRCGSSVRITSRTAARRSSGKTAPVGFANVGCA